MPSSSNALKYGRRDESLDALRGLDVLLMIIVDLQGSDAVSYTLLKHAPWNGLTFADLVFPLFLLITGLSTPLALDARSRQVTWAKILYRSSALFAIGIVLGWLIHPGYAFSEIRLTGVLQRIAIVYLVCAIITKWRGGIIAALLLASVLLAVHCLVLLNICAPNDAHPSMVKGTGISAWLDQHFLPGKLHRATWDPEGILSTAPAIATGLIGVATTRWLRSKEEKNIKLFAVGAILSLAGYLLTPIMPFNKNLWTASFALSTAGVGLVTWAGLRLAWPPIESTMIARSLATLGRGALTIYVVHMLLVTLLVRQTTSGRRVWDVAFGYLLRTNIYPNVASLLFALIASALCVGIFMYLNKRDWLLKV